MAKSTSAQNCGGLPATRVFGVETEYPIVELDADHRRLDPAASVETLMRTIKELVPHLHCTGNHDVFTVNGSRVYVDVGLHPEVATAECSTPEEAVLFTRAGDRLLARAARIMERAWARQGKEVETVVWKANVDHYTKATWGSHESYLHEAPQSVFANQLTSHLVTRMIYTGAGGFDNCASALRFVISPRASHLEHTISGESTHGRGVFHTRNEPLAASPNRRLHVLAGESLWSETADYLRIGTTALLVAQIDAGRRPQTDLDLAYPMQALATIAADVSCKATVKLCPPGALTAIAVQRRLLESVEADLGADHLPSWAASVCERWRDVLDRLEVSPSSLVGVLDWPTKLAMLGRQCEAEGLAWTFSGETAGGRPRNVSTGPHRAGETEIAARLRETDLRFTRLDDSGIFAALDREGALAHRIVSTDAIERAIHEPPSTGRARIRAAWVERLASKGPAISCNWDRIIDHESSKVLHLADPFQCEGGQWVPLPAATMGSSRNVDPLIVPIALAVSARAPREALRQMRVLLAGAEPLALSVCQYCAGVIERLVPLVPVPVLRRGGATAGPVLAALFGCAASHQDYSLQQRVGLLLYRYYEARGRYDRAAQVIEGLLARVRDEGDSGNVAVLTNNLGYEHMLAGRCETAEDLFQSAIALFEQGGRQHDAMNARANLLECRFARTRPERWHALLPTLKEVNRALMTNRDWRARKTLRLLARFAEHRGRPRAARGWVRRGIAVTQGVPTQLRKWDRAYLQALEARFPAPRRSRQ
jgi:proteasome accessory factor A